MAVVRWTTRARRSSSGRAHAFLNPGLASSPHVGAAPKRDDHPGPDSSPGWGEDSEARPLAADAELGEGLWEQAGESLLAPGHNATATTAPCHHPSPTAPKPDFVRQGSVVLSPPGRGGGPPPRAASDPDGVPVAGTACFEARSARTSAWRGCESPTGGPAGEAGSGLPSGSPPPCSPRRHPESPVRLVPQHGDVGRLTGRPTEDANSRSPS